MPSVILTGGGVAGESEWAWRLDVSSGDRGGVSGGGEERGESEKAS